MFGVILKAINSSFKKCMSFCHSIYVKKFMKLLAFIFEQPSYEHFSIFSLFSFQIICKSRFKVCFHNKSVHYSLKLHGKVNYLIKQVCFLLLVNICVPPIIIDS